MTISVPNNDKEYLLIDNFSSSGNIVDKTPSYPDTATWIELNDAATPYPCNAAGYVVANAATSQTRDWIVSSVSHQDTFKSRGVVSLGGADNVRLYFRCSSNSVLLGVGGNDHYQFRVKDDSSGLPLLRLQSKSGSDSGITITSTDGETEAVLGDISCTTKMPFTLELTDTQLICRIGGFSRTWPITEFAGNNYFGFACGGVTDKLHDLRLW